MRRVTRFTLLELMVVIVILALTAGIAVSAFREESPTSLLDRSTAEFDAFCSRVRFQAMEQAADRLVVFQPEQQLFQMAEPSNTADFSAAPAGMSDISWRLPDKFEFEGDDLQFSDDVRPDGTVEVFRFFPDGSAAGKNKLILRYRNLTRTMDLSPLTGLLRISEEEVQQ